MSRLIARILLAIFLIPSAAVVYLVVFFLYNRYGNRAFAGNYVDYATFMRRGYVMAGLATWALVAAWWFLLWRKGVRWTGGRIAYTAALFGACAIAGILISALFLESDRQFGQFVGSASAPLLWLVGTVFVWRESAAERASRVLAGEGAGGRSAVVCPTCGYNLTGLREARCPECGAQYTLDQLLAAQPERVASATAAELES